MRIRSLFVFLVLLMLLRRQKLRLWRFLTRMMTEMGEGDLVGEEGGGAVVGGEGDQEGLVGQGVGLGDVVEGGEAVQVGHLVEGREERRWKKMKERSREIGG